LADHATPLPFGWYYPDAGDPQVPSDAAVVIPTVLRPVLGRALDSVYAQRDVGRIQVTIGIDKAQESGEQLEAALARRPANISAIVLRLPFSTSIRHGGVHPAKDGGSLRAILAFMANSRHVAFLDDDNTWEPDHLASLLGAVRDKYWAYALRMLVDEETDEELGVDRWDSVGVDQGRFKADGGHVDVNCLLIDKVRAGRPLGRWAEGPGVQSDRHFFRAIKDLPHGRVERPTVRYGIRAHNVLNKFIRENTDF
jgi:hypothetical protein